MDEDRKKRIRENTFILREIIDKINDSQQYLIEGVLKPRIDILRDTSLYTLSLIAAMISIMVVPQFSKYISCKAFFIAGLLIACLNFAMTLVFRLRLVDYMEEIVVDKEKRYGASISKIQQMEYDTEGNLVTLNNELNEIRGKSYPKQGSTDTHSPYITNIILVVSILTFMLSLNFHS